jgi:methylenetetrahydrofolate dehydrogenase (NADP+)/methenyltetrahydrofolate cyclohydrolase
MRIDGNKIAEKIADELIQRVGVLPHRPVLSVVMVGEDPVIEKFVGIKKKFAERVGVLVEEHRFSSDIDTDTLVNKIEDLGMDESVHGVVVQLPLPPQIDTTSVLAAIPPEKDVDVISHEKVAAFNAGMSDILPPVVGAFKEILTHLDYSAAGKHVVIVGQGRLVGQPAGMWFEEEGADVVRVAGRTLHIESTVHDADILVLGAGVPGLITPEMVHSKMVILDAGTSEAGGRLAGDADPRCVDVVHAFTPVPGGVGPITVAVLFRNLITLIG